MWSRIVGNIRIISNNAQVLEKYPGLTQLVVGNVLAVYHAARDAIHQGAVLINDPLAGSVKPNQNPYRSLLLSAVAEGPLALDSLTQIESALRTLARLPKLNHPAYSEQLLEDFRFIDRSLLESALNSLPARYYF